MNKNDIITDVAAVTGATKSDAAAAVDAAFDAIAAGLQRGDRIAISGFGTFEVRDRAARMGRNPQTGEPIHVPASKAPAFKAGKALKDAVNYR